MYRLMLVLTVVLTGGYAPGAFASDDQDEMELQLPGAEQTQVQADPEQKTPWKIVLPLYFVGAIFTAGGISSLVVHGLVVEPEPVDSAAVPADDRRFHRNLGITSLVIGLPLLGLATYLLVTGGLQEARTSTAPSEETFSMVPLTSDAQGLAAGISVSGRF